MRHDENVRRKRQRDETGPAAAGVGLVTVVGRRAPSAELTGQPSLAEVVEAEWAGMVRLAVLLVGDVASAEDIVQECCERLLRAKPDLADRDHLIAYLRRSVVNRSRSARRREGTARRYLGFLRPKHAPAADQELLARQDQREILDALATLPVRQREVLVLRYWSLLSEAEIAATLDIPAGTVKSATHRALQALRHTLMGNR